MRTECKKDNVSFLWSKHQPEGSCSCSELRVIKWNYSVEIESVGWWIGGVEKRQNLISVRSKVDEERNKVNIKA